MTTTTQPAMRAFTVIKREGQDDFWLAIGAAFAHAHQIGNCNCSVIQPERKRRAVKIAAGNHFTTFREHKRIISGRCRFD